jgi:signal transduction histidine kinase
MAAMGELLSMIAHQWRQPLNAISTTLMSVDLRLKLNRYDMEDPAQREAFLAFLEEKHRKVGEYTTFLSHTIDDFRNFFSPNKEKKRMAVTLPVERALQLLSDSFSNHGIEVVTDYRTQKEIPLFHNEIMQVVLNILKNSEDNFAQVQKEDARITITTFEEEENIHIEICDNGGGIPENVYAQIFDPYFSTKDEQQGAGLGLYMSKVIVEKHHNGRLVVENIEEGVCFTIVLPR